MRRLVGDIGVRRLHTYITLPIRHVLELVRDEPLRATGDEDIQPLGDAGRDAVLPVSWSGCPSRWATISGRACVRPESGR